jgi:cell division protein FtsB
MSVNLGIWAKLTRLVVFLLVLAGILGVAVWYFPVIQKNERLRKQILQLDQENQRLEEANRKLKSEAESIERNPKKVERLARESLGYARTNETVVYFDPPSNRPTPARP